ncbi:MAG: hypothetical protein MJ151_00130 [Lachnospiraceae bacterium]|nr:hypothetical protein [Lachnospiraceae bacterium]
MEEIKRTTYKRIKKKKVVDKIYTTKTFDISFGLAEDIAEALDKITNKSSDIDILNVVIKNIKNVKPLMLDVFDGLTEEELSTANVKEVINVVMKIITYSIQQFNSIVVPKN